jgi:endonuclease/exonuclease/phosphatase family metal-dependent hydrolase
MKIKIITINCFDTPLSLKRSARIKHLISELILFKADVICFQELIFLKRVRRISKIFEDTGYHTFFTPGKRLNRGGLLIVSRYPIISSEYVKFKSQATPFSFQLTDRLLRKGYQKIIVDIDGKTFSIINTHLVSLYKRVSGKENIILLKQFLEFLNGIKEEKERAIVAGDFNMALSENLYKELQEKTNLYDPLRGENLVTVSKCNTQRKNFYKIRNDTRLDYILLSKDLKTVNQRIILDGLHTIRGKKINLSDHFGLMMEVED